MLKRSREDKSHLLKSGQQQSEQDLDFIDHTNAKSEPIKTSESIQPQVVENPNYTKIVSNHLPTRPCTPRYPVNKQLNGRKLKSRNSLRNKQNQVSKTMVVSVPQDATVDGHAKKPSADEDSDSSSLEDDDDFGGKKKILF